MKKAPNRETNNLHPLKSFCAREKLLPLLVSVCLVLFCFVLLVDFAWIYVFVRLKSFLEKINRLEIVLITSSTILLKKA